MYEKLVAIRTPSCFFLNVLSTFSSGTLKLASGDASIHLNINLHSNLLLLRKRFHEDYTTSYLLCKEIVKEFKID